jgi:hypothetical protein
MKYILCLLACCVLLAFPLMADDTADDVSPTEDVDSFFDAPPPPADNSSTGEQAAETSPSKPQRSTNTSGAFSSLVNNLQPLGFSASLTGKAHLGGDFTWKPPLWRLTKNTALPDPSLGASLSGYLTFDAQLSHELRLRASINVYYPKFSLSNAIEEFYINYNFNNKAYMQLGKYVASWGAAQNFQAGNLLVRAPKDITVKLQQDNGKDSPYLNAPYLVKFDIPYGVGGFQALGMVNADADFSSVKGNDVGFGFKYNLALQNADMDAAFFYENRQPLMSFASLKSTLFGSYESYFEGTTVIDHKTWTRAWFTADAGFTNTYFDNRLTANAEVFYNGANEENSYYYTTDKIQSAIQGKTVMASGMFYHGWNTALNLGWKFGGRFNPKLGLTWMHNFSSLTGKIIPAFSMDLMEGVSFVSALTMILGGYHNLRDYGGTDTLDSANNVVRQNVNRLEFTIGFNITGTYKTGVHK